MKGSWHLAITAGVALGIASLAGCQARMIEAGLTLPSGYYLEQIPEYIPPSPPFPLSNELQSLEDAAARQVPVGQEALGGVIP